MFTWRLSLFFAFNVRYGLLKVCKVSFSKLKMHIERNIKSKLLFVYKE